VDGRGRECGIDAVEDQLAELVWVQLGESADEDEEA